MAYVWYYRCQHCGHVWVVPKNDPDAAPKSVTVDETAAKPPGQRPEPDHT